MTIGPAGSTITKRGRYYIDTTTGASYPSVTTVLDAALSKPALNAWYAKTTAVRAVDALAELSRRVRLDGPDDTIRWLARAPREAASTAAIRGSDLHDLAERHATGQDLPADLADDVRAMLTQYQTFLTDFQPEISHAEMTVLNRTIGYGGTCDAVMTLPAFGAGPLIVDYKTGRTGPYAEWAIQLAAYAHGELVLARDGKQTTTRPMPEIDTSRALILRIRPDTYELHEADLTGLIGVFEAMTVIHAFTRADTPFKQCFPQHKNPEYWAESIRKAATVDDLNRIWIDAVAVNAWTDDLLTRCQRRKAEIDA